MTASSALLTVPDLDALPASAPAPIGEGSATPVAFTGERGAFFGLLVRGAFLQLVTFGFYRFWLITRIRRHLWSHTQVGGEALEFTGTAKEILLGFLVALAILSPIYIAYAILAIFLEEAQTYASFGLFVVFYALGHFGVYRGRRYRMNRTTYRGVRFSMDGSGLSYAGRALLWDALTIVTLGLAYPWRAAALEGYKTRHTQFGSVRASFSGKGSSLFQQIWLYWLCLIVASLGAVAYVKASLGQGSHISITSAVALIAIAVLCAGTFFIPVILARTTQWQAAATRFGSIGFVSTLKDRALLKPAAAFVLACALWVLVPVALIALIAGMVPSKFLSILQTTSTMGEALAFIAIVIGYIAFLLGFGVFKRYFIGRGFWRAIAASLSVINLEAVDEVVAGQGSTSGLDQGFADALDVGAL